ncbi:MAG: hypothetical protein V5A18_08970, partial [Haloarculaceae archaeon]
SSQRRAPAVPGRPSAGPPHHTSVAAQDQPSGGALHAGIPQRVPKHNPFAGGSRTAANVDV